MSRNQETDQMVTFKEHTCLVLEGGNKCKTEPELKKKSFIKKQFSKGVCT